MHLRPQQWQPEEYVARVLMMVCSVSAAEAASLAAQGGEVHVGTWERAIAEHAYAGVTAKGVLADLHPVHAHRKDALVAVQADGRALKHASEELQADRAVVLAAVEQDWEALEYASPEVRADRELVLEAVRQEGWALEYASKELQADREVVLAAVRQAGRALMSHVCLRGAAGGSRGGAGGRAAGWQSAQTCLAGGAGGSRGGAGGRGAGSGVALLYR